MTRWIAVAIGVLLMAVGMPARDDPKGQELPPLARSLLSQRMESHALSASELQWAVIFLESEETERIARALADEPRIARPLPGFPDELNSRIPARFFDLQDQMTAGATALADAAASGDADEIAFRYGDLIHACVSCHETYLE